MELSTTPLWSGSVWQLVFVLTEMHSRKVMRFTLSVLAPAYSPSAEPAEQFSLSPATVSNFGAASTSGNLAREPGPGSHSNRPSCATLGTTHRGLVPPYEPPLTTLI